MMRTSLFSTSLTALALREAIHATAEAGYDAIELMCAAPHMTFALAEGRGGEVRAWLSEASLPVSALSLSVEYTSDDEAAWRANVDQTVAFARMCESFGANLMKIMPGRPGSAEATATHWDRYRRAIDLIAPEARAAGVRLAVETHLNHLSDSIDTAARCVGCGPADVLGVNLDFCNIHTCGESALDAIGRFAGRIFLTHVKDSLFTAASGEYVPLGDGKMNYPPIIERLRQIGYDGDLSIECLYSQAKEHAPRECIAHDLGVLQNLLSS